MAELVKIKMLKNTRGSQHGHDVNHFEAGQTYDVTSSLADVFVAGKDAELVIEGKAKKGAPENKADTAAPENKAE